MPSRRRRAGLRARALRTAMPCLAVVALVGPALVPAPNAVAAPPGASTLTLHLEGPSHAAVGQVVSYRLVLDGATNVGAYQTNLRFDDGALGVVAVRPPRTLPGSGALTALSAVETPNRKVLAGWTCAGPGCAHSAAAPASTGVVLTTVDVEALRPGQIDLELDGTRIVNRAGHVLGTPSTIAVLDSAGGATTYAVPRGAVASTARPHAASHAAPLDTNGDGHVSAVDVDLLTASWVQAAETGASCATAPPGTDTDGDGCMTIADLQRVAGAITSPPAAAAATRDAVHAAAMATYIVNAIGDGGDKAADGLCLTAAGTCTLRAAIQQANRVSVPVTIAFAIAGTGLHTIAPASQLPTLVNPNGVTIDGFTQAGSAPNTDPLVDNAVYRIELKGEGASGINGLVMTSANNVIRGLNIHGFNRDIWIYGTKAVGNTVEGNMLGLTPTAAFDPGYTAVDSSNCVTIQQGATYTQVGAPGNANRNVVAGCNHQNISTYDYPTAYTTIQNNISGLDPTGKLKRGAKYHGIDINTGTEHTLIGGTGFEERNVVSGNNREGIEISHYPTTLYNQIIGNFVGTDVTGNAAPAYAANGFNGVHLEGEPSCNNDPCLPDAGNSTVSDNVIVDAHEGGILVDKGVHDSVIDDNKIGVTANGTAAPNLDYGVNIQAGSTHITVGPGNEIANNPAGVEMEPDGSEPVDKALTVTQYDTITQNSIHDNGTADPYGIDLTPFGTVNTAANADPDVNEAMLAPVLSNATSSSIDATTCAGCTVELFVADHPAGDYGSGSTYLDTQVADANGLASFTLAPSVIGDVVTADSTSMNGSTSEFSENVLIPGTRPGNVPPTAVFTPTCNGLACSFDGGASTDSDGTIIDYAWDFGDTATADGVTTTHNFSAPGAYTVQLTVTDNDNATNSTTTTVSVVDLPPTAAFTGSCNGLTCSFDASTSSDPDNSIASYSWDFGDTQTATGETLHHTYAAGNDYTVALTVDDGQGGTNTTSQVFSVTPATTGVVAADSFTRTVASGWGTADTGGAYAAAPGSGGASVKGTAGAYTLATPATGGGVYLPGVSVLDSDAVITVSTNLTPAGGTWGQVAYLTARRVTANTEYRVRLRFGPGGGVRMSFVKVVGNTTEVMIGNEINVPLKYAPNTQYRLRFDVTGTSPTTLHAKAWAASAAEPTAWTLTATDSQAALQAAGSPGVRVFLGGSSTNKPTWLFDDLTITNLG